MRILAGFIGDGTGGGVDAYLVAFARVAGEAGVCVDFLTNKYSEPFAKDLAAMGHGLYEIATLHNRASQRATMRRLCRENAYDAAYFNISTALMFPAVNDVRKMGVPCIVHSHASGNDQVSKVKQFVFDMLHCAYRPLLRRVAQKRVACSANAAKWLYGTTDDVTIVPNPVDLDACAYSEETRLRVRGEMGLNDKFVVGSVTAMKGVKNPCFTIDVFAEFRRRNQDAVLLMAGDGELADRVAAYAQDRLPEGSYWLLGRRDDVPELLQAFDVFVLTSYREGLPVAVLEAQAAGLPCLVSSCVSGEALVGVGAIRLSLSEGTGLWTNELDCVKRGKDVDERKSFSRELERAGYSLESPRIAMDVIASNVK